MGWRDRQTKNLLKSAGYRGGDTGTRTLDPMIKSHLLYQLSYVPKTGPGKGKLAFYFRGSGEILTQIKIKIKKKYYFFSFFCFLSFCSPNGTPVKCLLISNAATLSKSNQSKIFVVIVSKYFAEIRLFL